MSRRDRILTPLGALAGTGMEIGALHHPIVDRAEARVLYVDHADTATLQEKYADHKNVGDMVDVDVVWGDGSLGDALGDRGPVDWVIASHVIEHSPNLVGWLDELADVMRDGAILSLAVPDKRYCFDIHRRETDPADVVGAWLTDSGRPSLGTVYEFYARIRTVDAEQAWAGAYELDAADDNVDLGLEWARKAAATQDYVDVHCWTFTPTSFIATLRTLYRIGLTSFRVVAFTPTHVGEPEFFCALERLPRKLDKAERKRLQLASLPNPEATQTRRPAQVEAVVLSAKEIRLIATKRRVMEAARRAIHRARRAGAGRTAQKST
jgi:SAM-dependent methyltransferase